MADMTLRQSCLQMHAGQYWLRADLSVQTAAHPAPLPWGTWKFQWGVGVGLGDTTGVGVRQSEFAQVGLLSEVGLFLPI